MHSDKTKQNKTKLNKTKLRIPQGILFLCPRIRSKFVLRKSMASRNKLPIHLLTEEQKDFILSVVDTNIYFSYEEENGGLIHKLGVSTITGKCNPTVPVAKSDSMILFEKCTFDSFEHIPKIDGDVRFSECRILGWEGYENKYGDLVYSCSLPKVFWGFESSEKIPYNLGYCFLPSNGKMFLSSLSVDSRLGSTYSRIESLAKTMTQDSDNAKTADAITMDFERIWMTQLFHELPDVFSELMDGLSDKWQKRALKLAGISKDEYDLITRGRELIL